MITTTCHRVVWPVFLLALSLVPANPAIAAVTHIQPIQVDKEGLLPNFVTNDLLIDSEGNLHGQRIQLELSQGSIFNSSIGSYLPPNDVFFPVFPELAYDTFVTLGGPTEEESYPINTQCAIPEGCPITFTNTEIDIAWAPATGVMIPSASDFMVARITLSNDAMGTVHYFGATNDSDGFVARMPIAQGVIQIPEPATAALALIALAGSLGVAGRQCRSAAGVA